MNEKTLSRHRMSYRQRVKEAREEKERLKGFFDPHERENWLVGPAREAPFIRKSAMAK